ncbi:MAG: pyridoxal-5-phosphate-dependent protein subunit beta [Magnetococcales bacterium]|nr:pyridoxal-5-phosphate-dependent protein subunit beta [Magnetococcales bacterium]|tara:strand:- start:1284 stop:2174 length:891 start_codon:yes stop_codon:yes gene_type:complete
MKNSILDAIGNTPLIHKNGIFIKCEFLNPSGSIKARIAEYMIEKAEKEGLIKPGDTIVEATSGNTGNALAMVAAAKGYKMVVVMPGGFSEERVAISKAFGAEIMLEGHFDVSHALKKSRELGQKSGYWCPNQFGNAWNVEENREVLGQEIIKQLPSNVTIDAIVQGVGTGGTLIGVSQALKAHFPQIKVFAMEPDEAATIQCGEFREHLIEGISDGFIPDIIKKHRHKIDEIITIKGSDAIQEMKSIAKETGMFVGPSSGANYLAAQKIKQMYPEIKNILTFFCDEGEKYISDHYK